MKTEILMVLVLGVTLVSGCTEERTEKIPSQDNYEIFKTQKEAQNFFHKFKSEKIEQSASGMIAIDPKKVCESDGDCLLVSNYFSSLQVWCKLDPDAPGDWMLCPSEGFASASPQKVQFLTDVPKRYVPIAGDSRYKWKEEYYLTCLNPANLDESEAEGLEIENSVLHKCSCLTLAEHQENIGYGEGTEGVTATANPLTQIPPTGAVGGEIGVPENPGSDEQDPQKYCFSSWKSSNLIVSNIGAPEHPLEKGQYSFDITITNLGPDKCCETAQITEVFKDGEYLGALGLHSTYECFVFPDGAGILPNQSIEQGTGFINFNEAGSYALKSDIRCLIPEEGNTDNGLFEVNVQIE